MVVLLKFYELQDLRGRGKSKPPRWLEPLGPWYRACGSGEKLIPILSVVKNIKCFIHTQSAVSIWNTGQAESLGRIM
jgi:hypothetical protein